MSDLDDELSRTLHRHAENMSSTPLAFDDVRGQATSIRRRRRLATGLGVAAAIAVIVPTAMFATSGNDSSPQPASQTPTVTDTNTPSPSSTPTMGADPHALDVTDLPTGAPPADPARHRRRPTPCAQTGEATVRRTADGVVVEAGGRTFGPYLELARAGPQRRRHGGGVDDRRGRRDGLGGRCRASRSSWPDFGATDVRVAAITGTDCQRGKASDCAYYVSHWHDRSRQPEVTRDQRRRRIGNVDPDRKIIAVRDATDDGRVLGITEVTRRRHLLGRARPGAVRVDAAVGTCDYPLDEFSPDGATCWPATLTATASAPAQSRSSRRRATGWPTGATAEPRTRGFYNSAVWEDETHVLFTAYQDGKWSMVRMDVHGAMEYAIPPKKGDEMEVPWHFETR